MSAPSAPAEASLQLIAAREQRVELFHAVRGALGQAEARYISEPSEYEQGVIDGLRACLALIHPTPRNEEAKP